MEEWLIKFRNESINNNIYKMNKLLNLPCIRNKYNEIFYYMRKLKYVNINIVKYIIEYCVAHNINIHSNDEYIFFILCIHDDIEILDWFIKYCELKDNKINPHGFCKMFYNMHFISYHVNVIDYLTNIAIKNKYFNVCKSIDIFERIFYTNNINIIERILNYYFKENRRFKNINEIHIQNTKNINDIIDYLIYINKHKCNGFNSSNKYIYNEIYTDNHNNNMDRIITSRFFISKYIDITLDNKYIYNNTLYTLSDISIHNITTNDYVLYIKCLKKIYISIC